MLPTVVLTSALLERLGLSLDDIADLFFNRALAAAVPAGAGDVCPQCTRHHAEFEGRLLEPSPEGSLAPSMAAQVSCRAVVLCPCGAMYALAAVHAVDAQQALGAARVRAASARLTPGTGALQIDGQDVPPVVLAPSRPEPLPPGASNTLDAANQVVHITYEHRRRFHAATSFITPPFGPVRARDPLP